MIRCPNFRSEKTRDDFNKVLKRLGGEAMTVDDITPRQPYLAKLNEAQLRAYHVTHYLWNAHDTPAKIGEFLDALDAVQAALEKPVDIKLNPPKAPEKPPEPSSAPSAPSAEAAPLTNLPAINLARDLLDRLRSGKPISAKIMQAMASEIYGAKLAEEAGSGASPDEIAAGDEGMFALRNPSGWESADTSVAPLTEDEKGKLLQSANVGVRYTTDKFARQASKIAPILRAELDRMGLKDVALRLVDHMDVLINGMLRGTADGIYFTKTIMLALDTTAEGLVGTAHHEALHALRKLGLFKDSEWEILAQQSRATWRKQFNIDNKYNHIGDDRQTEEGVAHAYADWITGKLKVDGRLARLFKRIRDFFQALRNALHGLGFKSAEDVFRDIRSGEIGGRERPGEAEEQPMFSVRDTAAPSEAEPTPQLNGRIRALTERLLSSSTFNKAVEGLQDLSHPVKLLQNELEARRAGAFEDPEAFYVRKRLYPGRIAAWTTSFNKQHLDPIVNLLKSNKVSLEEAGDYLYALHAAERNEEIDKINPGVGGEGSGMSNEEAEKILAEAKRGENAAALDDLRTRVGKIRDLILNVMEKSGLEKPEVIDAWRKQYKDYVPLRGWEVEPDDAPEEFKGIGGPGFQVRGKEVKRALGRRSKADNPLVNIFDQAYRTFDRAERNRYLQSLYRAIDDIGEEAEDIATLDRGKPKREISKKTGLVRTVESSNEYANPRAVYLKFDGNPHFMLFKDKELAEAVKRMSPESMGETLQFVLNLQNKLKSLWTHYSPDFLFRHFMFRYPIEGALNSFEQKESGEHSVAKYVQESYPIFGTASKAIFAANKGERATDPHIAELQKYWDEMRKAGGAMMFRNMRDIDLTREHLQMALKDLSDKPIANARARWRHAIEAMDTVTNALDNSLRLAAYASARRQGKTPQQAAMIAREATVDFQLKGRWSNIAGILWPFANVATQTSARMAKAVYRSKTMRRVFMGTMAMGFLTSAFNYMIGGKDKDGVPFFDKIAPWDRRLNYIILNPFDHDAKGRPQPIKIPMPYNWAFPLFLGYSMGNVMFGSEGARKIASQIMASALETFTPLGSEGNLAMEFTPETLRPLGYVYTNMDWAGRPVHIDPTFQRRPNAYSGFKTTGEGWKDVAQGVNTATGGSPGRSGFLDLYPEDLRELLDPYVGTQLRFGQNVWDTASTVAKGQWPDPTKVPLERVVHGADYDAADRARYRELRDLQRHPWKH